MTAVIIKGRIERDEALLATTKILRRIALDQGEDYLAQLYAIDISHAEQRLELHRGALGRAVEGTAR